MAPRFSYVLKKCYPEKNNITFVEPYAGGAGAALKLLSEGKVSRVIINDFDINIYSFWKSFFDNYNSFIKELQSVSLSLEEWRKQKNILDDKHASLFERGFATFYLNRVNYSGIIGANPMGGVKQGGKWKLDARFNKKALIERLDYLYCFRESITVENRDGTEVIKDYLGKHDYFLYIDPPYVEQGESLYLAFKDAEEHRKLAALLTDSPYSNWLLSYDKTPLITQLYSSMELRETTLYHSLNRKKHDKEYLIFHPELGVA